MGNRRKKNKIHSRKRQCISTRKLTGKALGRKVNQGIRLKGAGNLVTTLDGQFTHILGDVKVNSHISTSCSSSPQEIQSVNEATSHPVAIRSLPDPDADFVSADRICSGDVESNRDAWAVQTQVETHAVSGPPEYTYQGVINYISRDEHVILVAPTLPDSSRGDNHNCFESRERSVVLDKVAGDPRGIDLSPENSSKIVSSSSTPCSQASSGLSEEQVAKELESLEESQRGIDGNSLSDQGTVCEVEIDGRRIVDLNYFLQKRGEAFHNHNIICKYPFTDCKLQKYIDKGLKTQLFFRCPQCDYSYNIWTDPDNCTKMGINESAVCGALTAGTGYYALQEQLAAMAIPAMSHVTFGKYRDLLFDSFKSAADEEMKKAAAKERNIAIQKGKVINGIPYIKVITDGCWAKRSYTGGKHDSLSGAAMIIGYETNLVLYVGVRNKYCAIHAEAERLHKEPPAHVCYKNWGRDQSSTAMETDIICQGFKDSISMHGLIFNTIISDGDSSSIQAIRDANPYAEHGVTVKKVECTNHLFRNLCKKMREASKIKIKSVAPQEGDLTIGRLRERVRASGLKIRTRVELARDSRNKENIPKTQKRILLQKDILSIFKHVFGDHSACDTLSIPCTPTKSEENLMRQIQATGIYPSAYEAVRYLSCHADSLLKGVTNNMVESGNSIITKMNSGKRINHCEKNSYELRVNGAVVQHNTQEVGSKVFIAKGKHVPTAVVKMETSRQLHVGNNRLRRHEQGRHKPRRYGGTDKDYGPSAQKPDIPKDAYDTLVQDHFDKLKKFQENRQNIERDTTLQTDSELWHQLRTDIVTASKFGPICKMLKSTSCSNMVASIRYPKVLDTAAIQFGIANEQAAKDALELRLGKSIMPCGLFIDPEIPYLGATPDGLIDSDGIVEVKCPFSAKDVTVDEAIQHNKNVRSIFDKNNMELMNKTHSYYYQVQGQLHISRRSYCIFALWTLRDLKCIKVFRDDAFWQSKMEPVLSRFYKECLVPEIVDPRRRRSMRIRDPEYIQNAQEETQRKKALNLDRKHKKDQMVRQSTAICVQTVEQDDCKSIVMEELPLIVSKVIRSDVTGTNRANVPWTRIEMDEEMEIAEDDIEVLEALRRNISVDAVIADIQGQTSLLNDTSIDLFQNIAEQNSHYRFNPASYTGYYRYIKPCKSKKDIQIIGGNGSEHWCCVHYDGTLLMVYDSLNPSEYDLLHSETKRYIQKRYPNILVDNIILQPVTRQPDSYSCGVYAIAFATTVALGDDPAHQVYSRNAMQMRAHLVRIIQNGKLIAFPSEEV